MAAGPPSSGRSGRFGRFRLIERRGGGGMGEVWHAIVDGPRGFEQSVVLKRLRREHTEDPAFVAMLAAEARVCARLDHPGIVKVFEFGVVDGQHYLAMELVDGWTLSEIADACARAGRAVPVGFLAHVAREVAEALAYAHTLADERGYPLGLVHRDVNPSNIMVTRQGRVKLLDFGVHTIRDRLPDERTVAGALKGTLAYMSPEQAQGKAVDGASDLFSLGVVLHEGLTGRRLFRAPSDAETLERVRAAEVASPRLARPDLDPRFERLVMQLLARTPAERPAGAAAVAEELRALTRDLGVDATSVRELLGSLALDDAIEPLGAPGARTQRLVPTEIGGSPWLWATIVTALCAAPFALPRCASHERARPPAPALSVDAARAPAPTPSR
jgi:serine/threonine protein kinase